jgi:hypothetical protein
MKSFASLVALALGFGLAGRAWAGPVEVIPKSLRGAIQPQAAVSADGAVHVTFGKGGTIYCATSRDGGRSFNGPVTVGSVPKLALGMRRGPRITASGKTVVVSAISHQEGNLTAWVSADQGATWSDGTRINSVTNAAREGMHAMAGDGKGAVHVAWLDLRSGRTELRGATSRDAGRTWGENVLIYTSPDGHICECCHPSLAVDARGRVSAMWRNWLGGSRDMYASVSGDGGKTFAAARKLGSGTWPLKGCPMDGGQLAFGPDDRLLTVWRRDKAIFSADENGESLVAGQGLHPVVGVVKGSPFYLWQRGPKLMLKKGPAEAAVFAENGAFASVASGPATVAPLIVWEASMNGVKTILAQSLE